jgi:hypothetical protein
MEPELLPLLFHRDVEGLALAPAVHLLAEHEDRGQEVIGQIWQLVDAVGEDPAEHDLVNATNDRFRGERCPSAAGDEFVNVVFDDLGEHSHGLVSPRYGARAGSQDLHDAHPRELRLACRELHVGPDACAQPLPHGLLFEVGTPDVPGLLVYHGIVNVYAQAQSAGQITNFNLVTWTQPLKFQLINPLLGDDCYIGSDDNPVVLNPSLRGTLVVENDPNPTSHPDTGVLEVTNGSATDTTFAAPGVTGCGPGGSANIAVDEAIDASAGLPAASGSNSLTLSGTFSLAVCFAPDNMARILLSAFRDSVGTPPPSGAAGQARRIPAASLHDGRYGIR